MQSGRGERPLRQRTAMTSLPQAARCRRPQGISDPRRGKPRSRDRARSRGRTRARGRFGRPRVQGPGKEGRRRRRRSGRPIRDPRPGAAARRGRRHSRPGHRRHCAPGRAELAHRDDSCQRERGYRSANLGRPRPQPAQGPIRPGSRIRHILRPLLEKNALGSTFRLWHGRRETTGMPARTAQWKP